MSDDELGGAEDFKKVKQRDEYAHALTQAARERKVYDRKATESVFQEEMAFHQYRTWKLQELGKREKHLLIFSNSNSMNFKDLNRMNEVKAWSVLFHFKNKTTDSVIYDLFFSEAKRNSLAKSKNHKLFNKLKNGFRDATQATGLVPKIGFKCHETGWPIDILL